MKKFDSFITKAAKLIDKEHHEGKAWIFYLSEIKQLLIGSPKNLVFITPVDLDADEDIAFEVYDPGAIGMNTCYHKLVVIDRELRQREQTIDYYHKIEDAKEYNFKVDEISETTNKILEMLDNVKYYKLNDSVGVYKGQVKGSKYTIKVKGIFAILDKK